MKSHLSRPAALLLWLVATLAGTTTAQTQLSATYTDALPHGAVARMGSVLFHHGGEASDLCFSNDGKWLATGGYDGRITLLEVAGGLRRRTWHQSTAGSVAISPDNRLLAYGRNGAIELVELESGQRRHVLETGESFELHIRAIAFPPNGEFIAAAGSEFRNPKGGGGTAVVRRWNVATGDRLPPLENPEASNFRGVVVAPNNRWMAAASAHDAISVWTLGEQSELRRLGEHERTAVSIAASSDGSQLAALLENEGVQLWDVASGKLVWQHLEPRTGLGPIAFSPDGKILAAYLGGTVSLWQMPSGEELGRLEVRETERDAAGEIQLTHAVQILKLAFSPDGSKLAGTGNDGAIYLWDVATRQGFPRAAGHAAGVTSLRFSPDGRTLASGSADTVHLWDAASGAHLRQIPHGRGPVVFSPDGKSLISGRHDQAFGVFSSTTGEATQDLPALTGLKLLHCDDRNRVLAISHSINAEPVLWLLRPGERLRTILPGDKSIGSLAMSPDGKLFVGHGETDALQLWSVNEQKEVAKSTTIPLPETLGNLNCAAFSPDGTHLAAGGYSQKVLICDVAAGAVRHVLSGHLEAIESVQFSPDGKFVASADAGGLVTLWHVATGVYLTEFRGERCKVTAVAFSPDGRRLATGRGDGTILIWDLAAVGMTTDIPAITSFSAGLKYLSKRDYKAAAEKFNEGVARAPKSFQGLRFRSTAYHSMGKDDEALADLAECIRINPTFEQPYVERAMILFKSGHYVQGRQAARAALASNPRDQFGRNFVAYGLRLEKKFPEAMAELDLLFSTTWEYTHAELNRCRIWCELGEPERALEACQKILDRQETAMRYPGVRGLFHFTRGYAYWVQNNTAQALDEYDEALRQHPDYAACLWFRAKAYTALGREEEADVDRRRALDLDPLLAQNPLRW